MRSRVNRRLMVGIAAAGVGVLALTGCTGDIADGGGEVDCAPYDQYGSFDGANVTIAGTILDLEADNLVKSWSDFQKCTGIEIDYQGTSWQTGEVFDQSYGRQPLNLPVTQYVKGFTQAVIGQKVGSTLLVSIPPELAYGTDPNAHQLGGQTLLFVIQIRAIK